MSARSFFDTHVLVYADDKATPASNVEPSSLLPSTGRNISSFVTRKLRVEAKIVRRKVELLAEFDLVVPDLDDILAAIDLHRLHGFSFGDALVLRAAKESACSILYSEDLIMMPDAPLRPLGKQPVGAPAR